LIANDSGILKFTPIKPVSVENYSDYPKLGCIAVVDNQKVIAMGIIIEVIRKLEK
jgi:elongation factor 1-alpha